ncbi:MAG: AsmA family protein, partial [Gammaproteobacteria bacterium]|nr:AsmA family protein [Gammaproteobacteria bacterium]
WKAPLVAQVKAATGYDITIAGDSGVKASYVPTLVVNDISIANVAWASQEKFVEIARVEVRPSIMPILFGSLIAEEVLFDGVRVNFETDGDGGANWRQQRDGAVAENALDFDMRAVALRKLSGFDIKLRFRSGWAQMEEVYRVDEVTVATNALAEPISIALSGVVRNHALEITGTIGTLESYAQNKSASVALQGSYGGAEMTLTGSIGQPRIFAGIDLDFKLHAETLNDFGPVTLGTTGVYELPKDQPVRIVAHATSTEFGPQIENFELRIGNLILK